MLAACSWLGALLPWRSTAALCHDRLGEHDLARSLVADELRLVRRSEAPRAIGITQTAQGMVAEKEEAVTILRDAVQTLETTETALEAASRAEVALGGSAPGGTAARGQGSAQAGP